MSKCQACHRVTNTVYERTYSCHCGSITACFQCANVPKCNKHERQMRTPYRNELTYNTCAFCKEEKVYRSGKETCDSNRTRQYHCDHRTDPCYRYLCANCVWEPKSMHGYGLLEAEKRKPQGSSDVLDY